MDTQWFLPSFPAQRDSCTTKSKAALTNQAGSKAILRSVRRANPMPYAVSVHIVLAFHDVNDAAEADHDVGQKTTNVHICDDRPFIPG
jgi:hypothetical protein